MDPTGKDSADAFHRVGPGEVISIPSDLPHAVRSGPAGATAVDAWSDPDVVIPSADGAATD